MGVGDASENLAEKLEEVKLKPSQADSAKSGLVARESLVDENHEDDKAEKTEPGSERGWVRDTLEDFVRFWLPAIICFFFIRGTIAEARYIPSGSMLPTLQIQDRILVEKVTSRLLGKPIDRRDIIVFYPPSSETGIADPKYPWMNLIPFFPETPPAFIKRVVAVAGDRVEVRAGVGIFVNGKLVQEAPDVPKPEYNLEVLGDIRGYSMNGQFLKPFGDSTAPIIVPPHHLFVLGDNHNNSSDGHVWGFLDDNRVIGRSCLTIWRNQWLGFLFHQ